VKKDMAERQARTKSMLDSLDAQTRVAMEGLRPGTYIRIRLTGEALNWIISRAGQTPSTEVTNCIDIRSTV
jgi:hypothetical protein